MFQAKTVYLFASIPVTDFAIAMKWYEQFLGFPPTLIASDIEAVWDLAEYRTIYIEVRPEDAGHNKFSLFVGDLDAVVADISKRGIESLKHETYPDGVRKFIYNGPDGNEIGIGGTPS